MGGSREPHHEGPRVPSPGVRILFGRQQGSTKERETRRLSVLKALPTGTQKYKCNYRDDENQDVGTGIYYQSHIRCQQDATTTKNSVHIAISMHAYICFYGRIHVKPQTGLNCTDIKTNHWRGTPGPNAAALPPWSAAVPESPGAGGPTQGPPLLSGTFPIDLTKTRLQIQGQKNDANFKEIRIAPAMLRQASYGTIKIGAYQSLKRLFVERPEDETLLINVVCGILSGVISSTIANPTDVLKIRMQAQNSSLQGGMIGNFIHIYQQEGTRGLWKGVSLTAQRAAIVVGVELPVYDLTKKHLILSGLMGDTVYTHFLSSFTCGLAGALASNPVDVVRTRMMNQRVLPDGRCPGYTGSLDCLLQVSGDVHLYAVVECLSWLIGFHVAF
ncbi:hypothetical protein EI555_013007 [Monodon monoceros]|uniref:Solute carrier family 25 member 30 n=1 Tax=Monodon monoceros TaxID=40151 RepID=A0A4U1EP18_MONMO|nr:hypothetical protein EI555_013007 [Monodon monoceros]